MVRRASSTLTPPQLLPAQSDPSRVSMTGVMASFSSPFDCRYVVKRFRFARRSPSRVVPAQTVPSPRSEEHTSELQSHLNIVCRLLLEKKNGSLSAASVNITFLTNELVYAQ